MVSYSLTVQVAAAAAAEVSTGPRTALAAVLAESRRRRHLRLLSRHCCRFDVANHRLVQQVEQEEEEASMELVKVGAAATVF